MESAIDFGDYIRLHKSQFIEELKELLRIPSVSAQQEHAKDMIACAEKVRDLLQGAGMKRSEILPTGGCPAVYAELIIDKNLPTVLVYGHYDVQPADPLELWNSPPFEPVVKDGKIYARGSADDKGQFMMHIKAIEIMVKHNQIPCNIKVLIEGEEEIGSSHLESLIKNNLDLLECDIIVISDSAMRSIEQPTIDVGMRGLCYIEVEVKGAERDLHSGVYGGAVPNPITILCEMIASLHDADGKIAIPHFYDKVVELSKEEKEALAALPHDDDLFKKEIGIKNTWGEKGYTTNERTGTRPALDLNGIWGGYTGEGGKTVLPAKAAAKISCRLVPNQRAEEISRLLINHLKEIAPSSVDVNIKNFQEGDPYVTPLDHIGYKAAQKAIERTFKKRPLPARGGGSIPIVSVFENLLKAKTIFLGFGLDSDNLHSPNEKFDIWNYLKGMETIPYFYHYYTDLYLNPTT